MKKECKENTGADQKAGVSIIQRDLPNKQVHLMKALCVSTKAVCCLLTPQTSETQLSLAVLDFSFQFVPMQTCGDHKFFKHRLCGDPQDEPGGSTQNLPFWPTTWQLFPHNKNTQLGRCKESKWSQPTCANSKNDCNQSLLYDSRGFQIWSCFLRKERNRTGCIYWVTRKKLHAANCGSCICKWIQENVS